MRIEEFGLNHLLGNDDSGIATMDPLGYLEFLHLTMNARLVLTDSGGLQEETTVLGVPCLTLRPNTERPITCTQGTNQVVGNSKTQILGAARSVLDQPFPNSRAPEKWDGRAAERIVEVLLQQ
jgi:UDP-N-acetylglucosamine 2-epimerase (non-hydrolysing)